MLLVVDNGSVYTQNLTSFLSSQKIEFTSIPSSELDLKKLQQFPIVILSGRRKNNPKMNAINSKIINHCISENKPLLGICYGAEILALTLGGTIKKTNSLQKGEEYINILEQNSIFEQNMQVFESHHFEISKLPKSLICIGNSKNCKYEIIQLKNSKIYGTQFHPEVTKDGQKIIDKFSKL